MSRKTRRLGGAVTAGMAAVGMSLAMVPSAVAVPDDEALDDDPSFDSSIERSVTYRIAGSDRIATAIAASQSRDWDCGAIIARSDAFPDALASGPLADALNVPILLNPPDELDPRVAAELERLAMDESCAENDLKVTIVGGTGAISEDVEDAILALDQVDINERIQGANRYETAVNIADYTLDMYAELGLSEVNVFLATGNKFPDALAAGAAAASDSGIVLLTKGWEMSRVTRNVLLNLDDFICSDDRGGSSTCPFDPNAPEVVAVGGPAAAAWPDADKAYVGTNRYETAAELAFGYFPAGPVGDDQFVGVASGAHYADAVLAGGYMANADGPLLLSRPHDLPASTTSYLNSIADQDNTAFVFGWYGALDSSIDAAVQDAITLPV